MHVYVREYVFVATQGQRESESLTKTYVFVEQEETFLNKNIQTHVWISTGCTKTLYITIQGHSYIVKDGEDIFDRSYVM